MFGNRKDLTRKLKTQLNFILYQIKNSSLYVWNEPHVPKQHIRVKPHLILTSIIGCTTLITPLALCSFF